MTEDYIEYMVRKKKESKDRFIIMLCFIGFAFFVATIPFLRSISVGLAALELFLCVKFVFPLTDIEYEYLYCDKMITVDKIMGQKKRKMVGEYKLDRIELVAPIDSYRVKEYDNRINKVEEFWSLSDSEEHKPYAIIFQGNIKVVLDLPEKFVKMMQMDAPRKVFFD